MVRIINRQLHGAQRDLLHGTQHLHGHFGLADAFSVPHEGGCHFRCALAHRGDDSVFGNRGYICFAGSIDNLAVPGIVAFAAHFRLQGLALKQLDRFC